MVGWREIINMGRTGRFSRSDEWYNLEPKDNGVVGIHKGMKFEPHSKAGILAKKQRN